MKARQWVLVITLILCLSVTVGALPQHEQLGPDGNGQTNLIGEERTPEVGPETLMAGARTPENLMALVQGAGQAAAATDPPPRPSEAVKAAVATRPPIRTIHDSRCSH